MIKTRKARLEDLPILYEFEQGIISYERPYDVTLKPDPINYYNLKSMILSEDSEVLVAVDGEEIVGSAYARKEQAKTYLKFEYYAYLGFMFVKPSHRGHGVNKLIIDGLKDWCKAKGLKELRLDVYDGNESALRAYTKAGFKSLLINMRMEI